MSGDGQDGRRTWRFAGVAAGAALVIVALLGYALFVYVQGRGSAGLGASAAGAAAAAAPTGGDASASASADVGAPAGAQASAPGEWQRPAVPEAGLVERSGVRITQVAITGGGGLLDLRFQVVDPAKANAIHDGLNPPAMVQASSGLVVNSLLMGHSHTDPFHAGETYYLVFENPGNLVQRGDQVSVLLGDAEVDGVVVQ